MPSVTDVQQYSSTTDEKSTLPPSTASSQQQQQQQQQQSLSSSNSMSTDGNSLDGLTQSILALEKKQRNLGKRKEKLESYEQEAKKGKELNKDQKEALAKYPEVIGQIECVKDILDQCRKIQAESIKNQKRLSKQMAEEKRLLISQRMIEYGQLRFLLDHRPTTLKTENSTLLDELSRLIIPTDNSSTTISRSVDAVLAIYHGGPLVSTIKQLTGKNPQELREIIEHIIKDSQHQQSPPQPQQIIEHQQYQPQEEQQEQEQEQQPEEEDTEKKLRKTNDQISREISSTNVNEEDLTHRNYSDYPLQFDTRNQTIILEQMMENSPFFSDDLNQKSISEENLIQSNLDQEQYLNNHPTDPSSTLISSAEQSNDHEQQQASNDDQWQSSRSSGNHPRNQQATRGHYYPRSAYSHQYQGQTQQWRGSTRGGRHNGSYPSMGQSAQQQAQARVYPDNGSRGRAGPNPNYRGNRGGNYRGGYRGGNANTHYYGNGNGNGNYSRPSSYQSNADQHRPVVPSANSVSS